MTPAEHEQDLGDLGFQRYTFSIVGVQKGATTTLSHLLSAHARICRPPRKELHYFDDESVDWAAADHAGYGTPRKHPGQEAMGDASPTYVFWPHALERMARYDPGMRLIAIFRDPIDRLVSQWVMTRERQGPKAPAWSEVVAFRPETLPSEIPEQFRGRRERSRFKRASAVVRGYYGDQLRRGFEAFPREQWLIFDFAGFLSDHREHLDRATDHVGVHRFRGYPDLPQLMSGDTEAAAAAGGRGPTGADVLGLARTFASQVETYAELSGLPVGHWTTSRLLAGDLDPAEQARAYCAKAGLR